MQMPRVSHYKFLVTDQQLAQEQVLELLPLVSEVNAVSEELDKQKYDNHFHSRLLPYTFLYR